MEIVLDIGGTNSRLAAAKGEGSLGDMAMWKTPKNFHEAMEVMKQKMEEATQGAPVGGMAAGVAGALDRDKKRVVRAPNLPDWEGKPLLEALTKIVGGKTILENDAALAGLGEATLGAGRRWEIMAFVTVSTGIGGARVVRGKIDANAAGFEPGQQIISVDSKTGYWEEFASGTAMERVYGKKPWDIDDPQAWENEARLIAIGLHNLSVIWSPEIIILGGGIIRSVDLEKVKAFMEEMKFFPKVPELRAAELGERSGLYGAMALLHTAGA